MQWGLEFGVEAQWPRPGAMRYSSGMAIQEIQCTVNQAQVGRLDRLIQELTGRSRAEIRGIFDHDCVVHNSAPCHEPGLMVTAGDLVVVRIDPHTRYHSKPKVRTHSDLQILHEDNDLLVVNKPPLLLTVPSARGEQHTLLSVVNYHLRRLQLHASVIHRLDFGTSGLLVFSKRREATPILQDQFRAHTVEREYAAIVAGTVTEDQGTFTSRLGTTKSLQRYSMEDDDEAGEIAITHYQVIERLKGATYVRARLETGRRNQIRVHFSEVGHPVLGEDRYTPKLAQHHYWRAQRLALDAQVLGFIHPRTRQPLRFESPLPEDFRLFLERTRL